ncbi:MAG: cobalamin-binding protein, partial [Actinomycetota bacterium]|nr:cobalamin-binding protein [Actinomycetota bacterium]
AGVRTALEDVSRRLTGAPRPRALALEWGDPPFVGGHWVPELVEVAGGENVLSGPGEPSRRATWDEVAAADPDVVVFMPCGYRLDAAVAEARELLERPAPAELRALRRGGFWATDAGALFSRCTPVVAAAAAVLAAVVHPERFPRVSARRAVRVGPLRATRTGAAPAIQS